MKILVACEKSGKVRDAFIKKGHNAVSCDILPSDTPGPHYHGNVIDILYEQWDMLIAFPPCTYLCSSGIHWNKRRPERQTLTDQAINFFCKFYKATHIERRAIENPVGIMSSVLYKPTQIVQPWEFGHDASKQTCLWLFNLPKLMPTEIIKPRYVDGKPRWGNQTDTGQNKLTPSPDRADKRSETYQGIALAMADQWSK